MVDAALSIMQPWAFECVKYSHKEYYEPTIIRYFLLAHASAVLP